MTTNTEKAQKRAEQASSFMHANDACAHTLNIQIEHVAPGEATASMVVDKAYANGHGFCQGGIITTLADTAFAHACNSYNQITVAQGLSIEFVRSAKIGERLLAVAKEQSRGRLTGLYQVKVFNQDRALVALMIGKSFARQESVFTENNENE